MARNPDDGGLIDPPPGWLKMLNAHGVENLAGGLNPQPFPSTHTLIIIANGYT